MTAVLALSIGSKIDHYGALAGVAAILGIGILAILYAAQAREVKRLREWAGRAPERDADLQQRVVDAAQRRAAVPVPPAQPVLRTQPATAAGVPTAVAVPAAMKLPGPATPAGAPAAAAAAVGAVAGAAAATTPAPATAGVTTAAPASAAAATPATAGAPTANGPATGGPTPNGPVAPPPAVAGGVAPPPASVPPQVVPATPAGAQPTMVVRPEAAAHRPRASPPAAAAAPLRTTAREAAVAEPPHRSRRNLAVVIFGGLAIAAIAALLITQVFNSNDGSTPAAPNRVVQPGQTAVQDPAGGGLPKLDRSKITVSVLNGTSVQGLARGASDKLLARGYTQGIVKTKIGAPAPMTAVYYAKGSNRPARDVARILGLDVRVVAPIAPDVQTLAGTASVVVVVGLDQAQ